MNHRTIWYGADPGGEKNFGLAALRDNGEFETWRCSSVDEVAARVRNAKGIGIDCPLWWARCKGGGRQVDAWLRETYKISSGTVQSVNSLRGAACVQGVLLAMRLRELDVDIPITESHPKAMLKALNLERDWKVIASHFGLRGDEPRSEHEVDALVGAIVAKNGFSANWKNDLAVSISRDNSELNPKNMWFGEVYYWWPDVAERRN